MRDPNRIDEFCATLAELWNKVPDWRFGQFVYNVISEVSNITNTPPFYIEDEVMLREMKNYFNKENKNG